MFLVGSYHKTGTVLIKNIFRNLNFLLNNTLQYKFKDHFNYFSDNEVKHTKSVIIIRNPYEIVCSGMRYHLVSEETWLHQQKPKFSGATYSQYINALKTEDDKLTFELNNCGKKTINSIYNDIKNRNPNKNIYIIRLEDLYDINNLPRICTELAIHLGMGTKYYNSIMRAFIATLKVNHHRTHSKNELTYKKLFKEQHYKEFKKLLPYDVMNVLGYDEDGIK